MYRVIEQHFNGMNRVTLAQVDNIYVVSACINGKEQHEDFQYINDTDDYFNELMSQL